jgi:hypothetical protein
VHPIILESLAQQRLDDLRGSRRSSRGSRGRRPEKDSSSETSGPIGRAQTRVGVWMVDAGTKLAAHGEGVREAAFGRHTAKI